MNKLLAVAASAATFAGVLAVTPTTAGAQPYDHRYDRHDDRHDRGDHRYDRRYDRGRHDGWRYGRYTCAAAATCIAPGPAAGVTGTGCASTATGSCTVVQRRTASVRRCTLNHRIERAFFSAISGPLAMGAGVVA